MNLCMLLDMAADGFGSRIVIGPRAGGFTAEQLRALSTGGAEKIRSAGAVNRVTEPGQALAGAIAVAEQICASSPVSVRATLAAIAAQAAEQDRSGWQATAHHAAGTRRGVRPGAPRPDRRDDRRLRRAVRLTRAGRITCRVGSGA